MNKDFQDIIDDTVNNVLSCTDIDDIESLIEIGLHKAFQYGLKISNENDQVLILSSIK